MHLESWIPLRYRTAARVAVLAVATVVTACTGNASLEESGDSEGWETLESRLDACDPWSTDPCTRIVCSVATTMAACVPSDTSSLCAAVLVCTDTYYRCTCPEDSFDANAAAVCSQDYDDCLLAIPFTE